MNHYRPLLLRVTASGSAALGGAGVSMQLPCGPMAGGSAEAALQTSSPLCHGVGNSLEELICQQYLGTEATLKHGVHSSLKLLFSLAQLSLRVAFSSGCCPPLVLPTPVPSPPACLFGQPLMASALTTGVTDTNFSATGWACVVMFEKLMVMNALS